MSSDVVALVRKGMPRKFPIATKVSANQYVVVMACGREAVRPNRVIHIIVDAMGFGLC